MHLYAVINFQNTFCLCVCHGCWKDPLYFLHSDSVFSRYKHALKMQIFKGDSQSNSLRIMQMHSFRAEITWRRPSKALSQALNTGTNATKSTFLGNSSVLQIAWTSLCTSSIQALHGSVALPGPGGVKSPVSALPACSCHRTAPHPIKWLFRKTLRKWLKKKYLHYRTRLQQKSRTCQPSQDGSEWMDAMLSTSDIFILTMCPVHNIWGAVCVFTQSNLREVLLFLWLDIDFKIKNYGLWCTTFTCTP